MKANHSVRAQCAWPVAPPLGLGVVSGCMLVLSGCPDWDGLSAGQVDSAGSDQLVVGDAEAVKCSRFAAPGGSDSGQGSATSPFATAQRLLDSLVNGETGCLRAGTYQADQLTMRTPGVTLAGAPGETATLKGHLEILSSAAGAVVRGLTLDGRNSAIQTGLNINADDVIIAHNEITNFNTASCVHIGTASTGDSPPRRVTIEANRVHHCGQLPANNVHQAISVGRSLDAVVRHNIVYANANRGIQLYPDADNTRVERNILDDNGQGVQLGGDGANTSNNNVVTLNVIANSARGYNLVDHWQGATGSGNTATKNCVWMPTTSQYQGSPAQSGIEANMAGLAASDNVVANPNFVDASKRDYRLNAGPCATLLAGSS